MVWQYPPPCMDLLNQTTTEFVYSKSTEFRDTHDHYKMAMYAYFLGVNWSIFLPDANLEFAVELFKHLINEFFSVLRVRQSSKDPVIMSPLV